MWSNFCIGGYTQIFFENSKLETNVLDAMFTKYVVFFLRQSDAVGSQSVSIVP